MNRLLFEFYEGNALNTEGKSFDDMIKSSNKELEDSHKFVQWLFPLKEKSNHNKNAPILDEETIEVMKNSPKCMGNLEVAVIRFIYFLNPEDSKEKPHWITPHNHNYLRITRIIKCCYLLGNISMAKIMYWMGMGNYHNYPSDIGANTVSFWADAIIGL